MSRTHAASARAGRRASLLALAAAIFLSLAPDAGAEILWRGDYETANFSQWTAVQAVPGRTSFVTDIVREGRYAARFEINPGDKPINATGERTEIYKETGEAAGVESWWAWSTYFGNDFNPNPDTLWNIFTDWHHSGCCGQANVHFEVDTTFSPWRIQLRTFGGDVNQNQRRFRLAELERNKWYDFVFHVRWAPDNTGFVEVWLNGQLVVPKTFTPTTYHGQHVYLKQGIYRGASALTTAIYHDGMRRGQSYEDVATLPAPAPAPAPTTEPAPAPAPTTEPAPAPVPTTEPAPSVTFEKRPKIRRGRKVKITARSLQSTWLELRVRGPQGRILGETRARTDAAGRLETSLFLPRWRYQRQLHVILRLPVADRVERAATVLRLSHRDLRTATRA